jgi:hypothetical protein
MLPAPIAHAAVLGGDYLICVAPRTALGALFALVIRSLSHPYFSSTSISFHENKYIHKCFMYPNQHVK